MSALRRLGPPGITAAEAPEGELFPSGLEFNPPAHGVWNIVHIGMLVPQAHQIYVCAVNCMRGVVLTAAEMGASDRFSCVILKEEDILCGDVERITYEGIADVLRKLPALPPCVIVFPVCTHHFLGIHMEYIYRKLEEDFPGVDFIRAFMDPVFRKKLPPDQRLRKVMYDPLPPCEADESLVSLMGSEFKHGTDSDLPGLLASGGLVLRSVHDCTDYEGFKGLSRAGHFLCVDPAGDAGASAAARRLGRGYLYLPKSFSYMEIRSMQRRLCTELGLPEPDHAARAAACDEILERTCRVLDGVSVEIDASFHPRPLGLARLLAEHGFRVEAVFLDAAAREEQNDLEWLRSHVPQMRLMPITRPEMRVSRRLSEGPVLALGQKAAWFAGTDRFVNIVQGGGLWGYAGITALCGMMEEAWNEPKDTRDLIPRKGLGCISCI